ncbi:olfactory receptor 56 [Tupaia chinensis]|uniref:olfactory receptor 56 n=1 Tax=Tupaia chinensis TaxID=246437 RepID=UPI000FFC765D|nr:olfactory receptor 56 [Tupaia chinensis]
MLRVDDAHCPVQIRIKTRRHVALQGYSEMTVERRGCTPPAEPSGTWGMRSLWHPTARHVSLKREGFLQQTRAALKVSMVTVCFFDLFLFIMSSPCRAQAFHPKPSTPRRPPAAPGPGRRAPRAMAWAGNQTLITHFVLLGLFARSPLHDLLFSAVMLAFVVALAGNALLLLLIRAAARLHSPMYFLLSWLALADLALVCTVVPRMAADFLRGAGRISFAGCGLQILAFLTLLGDECFLLAFMAYDRYALATCSSHMTAVSLFYGAAMVTYMRPQAYHSSGQDKVASAFYTVITPMLNPLIYSLRNKEVTGALRRLLGRCPCAGRGLAGAGA